MKFTHPFRTVLKVLGTAFAVATLVYANVGELDSTAMAAKGGGKPSGNLSANIDVSPVYNVKGDGTGFYADGSGKDKIFVQLVLGGHLDFNTSGSAKADKIGDGRTLSIDFPSSITILDNDGNPISISSTQPGGGLPDGTITESRMVLGSARFGDEPDGTANQGYNNEQDYVHEFDLRAMTLHEIRHDVNLRIVIFIKYANGTGSVLRLFFDPAGTPASRQGSDFVSVECIGLDGNGLPNRWRIFSQAEYVVPGAPGGTTLMSPSRAAIYEGGGGDIFRGIMPISFEATLSLP